MSRLEELEKAFEDADAADDAAWDAVAAADVAAADAADAAYDADADCYKAMQELKAYKKEHGL